MRKLRSRMEKALHLDHCFDRVNDAEKNHRVYLHRNVVARDHILGRNVERDQAKTHLHHAVDGTEDENEARPLRVGQEFPQAKNDASLVLVENLDPVEEEDCEKNKTNKPSQR